MIANFISFVKHFFQKFLTNDPYRFVATSVGYHILPCLSTTFFEAFQLLFSGPRRDVHLSDSFVRIPKHSSKVNPVFLGLCIFLDLLQFFYLFIPHSRRFLIDSLYFISSPYPLFIFPPITSLFQANVQAEYLCFCPN